jgi:murein DD-endopeptidase MepM/ murein hydrolase activator NlpD
LVRAALVAKVFLGKAAVVVARGMAWIGRQIFLPILVRVYRLIDRLRRALKPAERRFVLVAAHRGILHGVVVAVALTTAGGNIYAQTQATVSSGEESVLYRYITGDSDIVEESGPPSADVDSQYLNNALGTNAQDQAASAQDVDVDEFDQESDTMIELGALMPQTISGASGQVHRTQVETYAVASGDTLSGIADRFGISIATIMWANNLTVHDFIQPGQKLTILPTTGILYKVKDGDTVTKIAANYGVNADEIKSWNGVADDTKLQKGQDLLVPGGRVITPAAPKPKPKPIATPVKPTAKLPNASDNGDTDLLWPSSTHYISQPYGIWSRISGGLHTGVDLAAATGTPIYAAEDGIVTHAGCGAKGCKKSYGLYVDIDHGEGIATRYGHASKLLVSVGDHVRRGQVIALMGSTGRSSGPHLHFEVRKNGRYVNPMPYIR